MENKSKVTWENIKSYLQGNIRYQLFYSKKFNKWIRLHIFEQINYRLFKMDKDCLRKGECKMCGCQTTALQMADKACNKPCYPAMMNKKDWEAFKRTKQIYFIYGTSKEAIKSRKFELRIMSRYTF